MNFERRHQASKNQQPKSDFSGVALMVGSKESIIKNYHEIFPPLICRDGIGGPILRGTLGGINQWLYMERTARWVKICGF